MFKLTYDLMGVDVEVELRDPEIGDVFTVRGSVIERQNIYTFLRQCQHDTILMWREMDFEFTGLTEDKREALRDLNDINLGKIVNLEFNDQVFDGIMDEFEMETERDSCSYTVRFKFHSTNVND